MGMNEKKFNNTIHLTINLASEGLSIERDGEAVLLTKGANIRAERAEKELAQAKEELARARARAGSQGSDMVQQQSATEAERMAAQPFRKSSHVRYMEEQRAIHDAKPRNFQPGQDVFITGGLYHFKTGTIDKVDAVNRLLTVVVHNEKKSEERLPYQCIDLLGTMNGACDKQLDETVLKTHKS